MTHPASTRWMLAALCLALLVFRVGGIHLHLCFDGSEPPLSYHLSDSGIHHADEADHGAGQEEAHSDRDISVASDLLTKSAAKYSALVLIAFALFLFLVSRPRVFLRTAYVSPLRAPARSFLRPPLRGPPAFV